MTKLEQATARFQRAEAEVNAAAQEMREIVSAKMRRLPRPVLHAKLTSRANAMVQTILQEAAVFHSVAVDEILSRRRHAGFVVARQRAMVLCRVLVNLTFEHVGEIFGRDHGTVMYAAEAVNSRRATEPLYAAEFADFTARCTATLEKEKVA